MKTLKNQLLDDLRDLELKLKLVTVSDKSQIEEAHVSWAPQNAVLVISCETGSPLFSFFDSTFDHKRDDVLARNGCYMDWVNHAVAAIYRHNPADIYDSQKIYDQD